ncbi:glycosyltransferase family 2 protein [Pedobacter aquatilis]|uniref:glycosyltransferase family 2 protein n=1 Tax=Pedobacter aquatilis TaxID=351343 RepID=UPI00292DF507|nr:glycosyltransferase family 2 protein [Pedobacter aquatilis]
MPKEPNINVSIIVPCFNQGCYLHDTLLSIENQTYQDWECIIVNDGSIDDTELIAKQFAERDNRFLYIYQANRGLSNARNTGISNAKGSYIQFLDSDDLLTPSKLTTTVNLYNQNGNSNIIYYSSMRYFENDLPDALKIIGRNDFIAHVELKKNDSLDSQKEVIMLRNPFVISAPIYPLYLLKKIGDFDESLKALEDWDFHIRCTKDGVKFHHFYEQDSLTLIRLHNNSMMRNQLLMDQNFHSLIQKHKIREIPVAEVKSLKQFIKEFIPPIFLKIKSKL